MKLKLFLTSMLFASAVHAADNPPAKEVQCRACHGADGAAPIMGSYPKLNGQNKDYLVQSLKDYRDGKRTGPMSAIMSVQAAQLSDADINELSAYYSSK